MARYSLSDYILVVTIPSEIKSLFSIGTTSDGQTTSKDETSFSIGGNNSYTGSVTVSYKTDQWITTGDATGSWVHTMSRDRTGTVSVSINQVSDRIKTLIRLCQAYYDLNSSQNIGENNAFDGTASFSDKDVSSVSRGITLTVNDRNNNVLCTCLDCYITKIADQQFAASPNDQNWSFTSGRITFED